MQRICLFFLFALLSMTLNADVVEIEGIYYKIEGLEAEVTLNPDKYYGDVIIPTSINYRGFKYKVTSIGKWAFLGCDCLTSVIITNNIKTIGEGAFKDCSNLSSVIMSRSVKIIEEWAFSDCEGLTSISIPSSVTSISNSAFMGCCNLISINVEISNPVYDSRDNCNAVIETKTNTLIAGCQRTVIPNTVSNIGQGAFFGCSAMTNIKIPNSVTNIGSIAFRKCKGLNSIIIPNSVISIGGAAFCECTSLESVTLPKNITTLGESAFNGCTALTHITIPKNITNMGDGTFNGCFNLKDLYCYATTPPVAFETTFTYCRNITLHVPASSVNAYRAKYPWRYFKNIVSIVHSRQQ